MTAAAAIAGLRAAADSLAIDTAVWVARDHNEPLEFQPEATAARENALKTIDETISSCASCAVSSPAAPTGPAAGTPERLRPAQRSEHVEKLRLPGSRHRAGRQPGRSGSWSSRTSSRVRCRGAGPCRARKWR
jgi:hypothetical protein